MDKINHNRRKILSLGATAVGMSLLPKTLLAAKPLSNSRTLFVKALNLGETLISTYFDGKDYVPAELDKLNYLFRDRRSKESLEMDIALFDQLYQLQSYFGRDKAIMMICGYRSPITNTSMKTSNTGVADKSYHISGQAVDFYIDNVPLKMVQEAALALKAGGVGYYPKSNFVHIDSGPVRVWPASSATIETSLINNGGPAKLPSSTVTASAMPKTSSVKASISPSLTKTSTKSNTVKGGQIKRLAP